MSKRIALACAACLVSLFATGESVSQYPPAAQCPQPRFTGKAPDPIYGASSPLTRDTANIAAGRRLYEKEASPSCQVCHGIRGDGMGPLAAQFDPRPRNFACKETVKGIPDGQLFWIVQNGSPGTSMPAFPALRDTQIWQIVLYLRELAR